jgi:hypothetical protein
MSDIRYAPISKAFARWGLLAPLLASLFAAELPAQFIPTAGGGFDYNTAGNWNGGIANGQFTQTLLPHKL